MIEVDHPNKCNTVTPPSLRPTVFYLIFIFFSISHAKLADFKLLAQ